MLERVRQVKGSSTNKTQEKLEEIVKDLPPDKLRKLNEELYHFVCKSIIALLKDSIAGPMCKE